MQDENRNNAAPETQPPDQNPFAGGILRFIGSCAYIGKLPLMPGTFLSAAAVVLFYLLYTYIGWQFVLELTFVLWAVGVPIATWFERKVGAEDPREFVLDELVGVWIALAGPWTFPNETTGFAVLLIAGFFLFRFFDILKPYPVNKLDQLGGGFGIMADDVMAGIYVQAILRIAWLIL